MGIPRLTVTLFGWLVVFLLTFHSPSRAAGVEGCDFSRAELTQMLAPVALYPDGLLSQVLMAATYPLEVVEADRWVRKNPTLKGENLDDALRDKDWDASVKALCHLPALLGLMSERLEETTRLGDAFLAQEKEVMDIIQDLRVRAMREGNLKSDDKQKVTVLADGTVVIEPAEPEVVHVPYYNTRYVYGPWWYPAWPPWYWGPGEVVVGGSVYFWPEVYFGFGFGYWSYFDWPGRTIVIDVRHRPRFFRPDYDWDRYRGRWRHEPHHRRGAIYRDRHIAEHFGEPPERVRRAERRESGSRPRGPVTGTGTAAEKVDPGKSGAAGRKTEGRTLEERKGELVSGERNRDRGASAEESRPRLRETVERRSKEADSVQPVAPGLGGLSAEVPERRTKEERRERPDRRELSTEDEGSEGPGGAGRYERRERPERRDRPEREERRERGNWR